LVLHAIDNFYLSIKPDRGNRMLTSRTRVNVVDRHPERVSRVVMELGLFQAKADGHRYKNIFRFASFFIVAD
jgi:hypothetical protein